MYSIGQVIRLLNEPIEGRVKSILPGNRLEVEDTHGFTRILAEREVVPIIQPVPDAIPAAPARGPSTGLSNQSPFVQRDLLSLMESEEGNLLLDFMPDQHDKSVKVTLVNATGWSISMVISLVKGELRSGADHFLLDARSVREIGSFEVDSIAGKGGMELQLLFFRSTDHRPREPFVRTISLTKEEIRSVFERKRPDVPPGILKPLLVLRELENDLEKLFDRYAAAQSASSTTATPSKSTSKRKLRTGKERVVDLHIESLVQDIASLNAGQIIACQLSAFEKEMDKAHLDQLDRIIFIHGIGSGILRSSIREALKHYENVHFGDAAFERFGRGATQVDFL